MLLPFPSFENIDQNFVALTFFPFFFTLFLIKEFTFCALRAIMRFRDYDFMPDELDDHRILRIYLRDERYAVETKRPTILRAHNTVLFLRSSVKFQKYPRTADVSD